MTATALPDIADYGTSQHRVTSGNGRDLPNPRLSPGATLQQLALGDPADAAREIRRLWPALFARVLARARAEGQRPYPMLFDLLERGLEASEGWASEDWAGESAGSAA